MFIQLCSPEDTCGMMVATQVDLGPSSQSLMKQSLTDMGTGKSDLCDSVTEVLSSQVTLGCFKPTIKLTSPPLHLNFTTYPKDYNRKNFAVPILLFNRKSYKQFKNIWPKIFH